eukprot:TRINITY_DN1084_c0_g1_i2.p2 TRINITY_DN1084_c0_g1~~TRINITY_DN1084_c0_g1_i2.p2  ORF type:complete len:275 (-),score=-12.11 TRINITY_DN1084_c0_g1_i2:196-1020(-)
MRLWYYNYYYLNIHIQRLRLVVKIVYWYVQLRVLLYSTVKLQIFFHLFNAFLQTELLQYIQQLWFNVQSCFCQVVNFDSFDFTLKVLQLLISIFLVQYLAAIVYFKTLRWNVIMPYDFKEKLYVLMCLFDFVGWRRVQFPQILESTSQKKNEQKYEYAVIHTVSVLYKRKQVVCFMQLNYCISADVKLDNSMLLSRYTIILDLLINRQLVCHQYQSFNCFDVARLSRQIDSQCETKIVCLVALEIKRDTFFILFAGFLFWGKLVFNHSFWVQHF